MRELVESSKKKKGQKTEGKKVADFKGEACDAGLDFQP